MEIKVRAWDKKEKKMIENVGVFYSDNTAYIYRYTSPELGYVEVFINTKYPDRFIPMLYTTRKDKNGREIYEGDIIKYDEKYIAVVIWENGGFVLKYIDGVDNRLSSSWYDPMDSKITEVIGNVWENPNLLKGGKNATK